MIYMIAFISMFVFLALSVVFALRFILNKKKPYSIFVSVLMFLLFLTNLYISNVDRCYNKANQLSSRYYQLLENRISYEQELFDTYIINNTDNLDNETRVEAYNTLLNKYQNELYGETSQLLLEIASIDKYLYWRNVK